MTSFLGVPVSVGGVVVKIEFPLFLFAFFFLRGALFMVVVGKHSTFLLIVV